MRKKRKNRQELDTASEFDLTKLERRGGGVLRKTGSRRGAHRAGLFVMPGVVVPVMFVVPCFVQYGNQQPSEHQQRARCRGDSFQTGPRFEHGRILWQNCRAISTGDFQLLENSDALNSISWNFISR
jgi:hypothetical protein